MADETRPEASVATSSSFRDQSLGYQVNLLARMMEQALAREIRPYGVVPGQFAQLLALMEHDAQSVTDLAAEVAIEHSTMSRTLSRMERDGLVVSRPNPHDGRSRHIHLTEHARSLEPSLKAAANSVNQSFLAELTESQAAELLALLKSLTSTMGGESASG